MEDWKALHAQNCNHRPSRQLSFSLWHGFSICERFASYFKSHQVPNHAKTFFNPSTWLAVNRFGNSTSALTSKSPLALLAPFLEIGMPSPTNRLTTVPGPTGVPPPVVVGAFTSTVNFRPSRVSIVRVMGPPASASESESLSE